MSALFKKSNRLYLVTDRGISGISHKQIVQKAFAAGIRTVQFREKDMTKKELFRHALEVKKYISRKNIVFIINDHIDVALSVDADGVHLGQDDMPLKEARRIMGNRRIIGISTHSLKQAIEAEHGGADYIGFGPVYKTATKQAGTSRGIKALREIRKHVRIPIVAIGGIKPENIQEVMKAGADAAAIISGLLSGNIMANTENYFASLKKSG